MIVTHINGMNARAFLEEDAKIRWQKGGNFSSPQRARLFAYRIPLQGNFGQQHQLSLSDDETLSKKVVTITNKWEAVGWPHTYAMPDGLTRIGNYR
jgi:hypothetical protein